VRAWVPSPAPQRKAGRGEEGEEKRRRRRRRRGRGGRGGGGGGRKKEDRRRRSLSVLVSWDFLHLIHLPVSGHAVLKQSPARGLK
jgi:hypothetical protein